MKILYISTLSTNIAAGLNWSVPASVKAQEKIDECLWINTSNVVMDHWKQTLCFHNLSEYGEKLSLSVLPSPFNKPDIVIFEGFYKPDHVKFAKQLYKNNIPYIIVPRCSLTNQAMNNHSKWKKRIAHFLFFDQYVHRAAAVQYLTKDEYNDSGDKWNKHHFVLPNGFSTPKNVKTYFHKDCIKASFIGRLDMHQKGLDVLLRSIEFLKDDLRKEKFSLCLYGPKRYQYELLNDIIKDSNISDIVSLGGEITGKAKENVLLESDLFVLTSRFEGHPMGLIEALAYGVPAIVTPGSNMAKEIKDFNAGWTSEDVTEKEIISMLRRVICDRDQFCIKSKNAIELAKPYDWDKLAIKLHDELHKLLS